MVSPATRTLIVTTQHELRRGHSDSKGDWVMYEVEACDEHGQPIVANLRSFEVLPEGDPIEVEVEDRTTEKWGPQYTLRPVREPDKSGKRASRLDALERQVNEWSARLDDLSDRLAKVEAAVGRILKALKEPT